MIFVKREIGGIVLKPVRRSGSRDHREHARFTETLWVGGLKRHLGLWIPSDPRVRSRASSLIKLMRGRERNLVVGFVPEPQPLVQAVVVAAPLFRDHDIAFVGEVAEDAVGCPFGDTHLVRDAAKTSIRMTGDHEEDVEVICEERPGLLGRSHERSLQTLEICF